MSANADNGNSYCVEPLVTSEPYHHQHHRRNDMELPADEHGRIKMFDFAFRQEQFSIFATVCIGFTPLVLSLIWIASHLNTETSSTVSLTYFGSLFFISWMMSITIQILFNYKRKLTMGLSIDAIYIMAYAFLSLFLFSIFCYHKSRFTDDLWFDEYGQSLAPFLVSSSSLIASSLYCILGATIIMFQMYNYDGFYRGRNLLSRNTKFALFFLTMCNIVYIILASRGIRKIGPIPCTFNQWLFSLLYTFTCVLGLKGVPQVYKNRRLRMFEGTCVASLLLEMIGSVALLVYAAINGFVDNGYGVFNSISHRLLPCLLAALNLLMNVILLTQYTKYELCPLTVDDVSHI